MKVKDFLTEDRWCRGVMACDKEGKQVKALSQEAVKWCLVGAIRYCYRGEDWEPALDKLKECVKKSGFGPRITGFNDSVRWEDVKSVLEEADV